MDHKEMNAGNQSVVLPTILVYQDCNSDVMVDYLRSQGFDILVADDTNYKRLIKETQYDLCIFDHYKTALPGDLRVLKQLRKDDENTPVIMVSALSYPEHIIKAFEEGTDDYVTKPYNLQELVCRARAFLRRVGANIRNIDGCYTIGEYILDTATKVLWHDKQTFKLTERECKILGALCAYRGKVLPKQLLLNHVWKHDSLFSKRSLDVYIYHLRQYLSYDTRIQITTVRSTGYLLSITESSDSDKEP